MLDSQPADDEETRGEDGAIKRKPLKHKKRIEPGGCRMIPIQDIRAVKILVDRFNAQAALCKKKKFGDDKGNYLLFDGMNKNRISNKLRKAYSALKFERKSPHDCRHTYCTNTVAQTEGHFFLAKYVLGHSDSKTTEGYMHLWELIQRQVVQEAQTESELELSDVLGG